MFYQSSHSPVVVVRIMMKKEKLFDAGLESKGDGIIDTTMPPAGVRFIFRFVELRIQNENIGIPHKIEHLKVFSAGAGFRIGKKGDQSIRGKKPVTDADAGMVGAESPHQNLADGKVEIF